GGRDRADPEPGGGLCARAHPRELRLPRADRDADVAPDRLRGGSPDRICRRQLHEDAAPEHPARPARAAGRRGGGRGIPLFPGLRLYDRAGDQCQRRDDFPLTDSREATAMQQAREILARLHLPQGDRHDLPSSDKRFPDGAQYRIEIPSCEGPAALRAVIEEADRYGIVIQRISQGSGIMLLTDEEITDMARLGRERGMEVSLFVGPRAAWDVGATAASGAGRVVAPRIRGADQLVFAVEDVRRACALGIRSVLVADEGLLWILGEAKRAGTLPADLVLKVSVMMGSANPAAIVVMERL